MAQLVLPLPNRTDFGSIWRKLKNSRTLSAEIAWNTWYCVVYGIPQFSGSIFQDHRECLFYHRQNVSNLLLTRIRFKCTSRGPLVLASQELQEVIKKLEEEVLERACLPSRCLRSCVMEICMVERCSNLDTNRIIMKLHFEFHLLYKTKMKTGTSEEEALGRCGCRLGATIQGGECICTSNFKC